MTDPGNSKPAGPAKREFAFSRVAGASPTDYAAVSSTAVWALVLSVFCLLGLVWVWGLVVPVITLGLAMLSLYRIATSAGTLTGRKVALTAVAVSVLVGGAGAVLQAVGFYRQRADAAEVRLLAERACRLVDGGDYEVLYREQLSPQYRAGVPLGYWLYEWRRFFDLRGPASRIELAERTVFARGGQLVVTMKIYIADREAEARTGQPGERAVPVRLVYQRDEAGSWLLVMLPAFISPLPPPYVEPIVWPSPGQVRRFLQTPAGQVVTEDVWPAKSPATAADEQGRTVLGTLALPPLVPPDPDYSRWLPVPAPADYQAHRHHHH